MAYPESITPTDCDFLSTRGVAKLLGLHVSKLQQSVWRGQVSAPKKSPSGDYLWTEEDANRASWALCHRPLRAPQGEADKEGA